MEESLKIFPLIESHVTSSYLSCSNAVLIADPQLQLSNTPNHFSHKPTVTTLLILSLISLQNETNISYSYAYKHCRPYSIVLVEVPQELFTAGAEWKLVEYPGSPWNDYHIFMMSQQATNNSDQRSVDNLMRFAKRTRKIIRSFYSITSEEECNSQVFTLASNSEHLNLLSERSQLLLFEANFEGALLVALVCANCGEARDLLRTGDLWYDLYSALSIEIALSVNATFEFEAMFSLPREKRSEDDEWDDWAVGLIDGGAAIGTISRYTPLGRPAFYYTRPFVIESAIFITAQPKLAQNSEVMALLISPFKITIWIAIACSIMLLFLVLEVIIYLNEALRAKSSLKKASCRSGEKYQFAFTALLKPTIDQGGCRSFEKTVKNIHTARLLLTVWLLVVIVLGSAYKSEFTSKIVIPNYTTPPSTFRELAKSHYKLYAVAWEGNLEMEFEQFHADYSRIILERVTEYNYFDSDCYQSIFKGDNACLGYQGMFDLLGIYHLIDTRGKTLFVTSKQTLFPMAMNFGLSKNYGSIQAPSNFILGALESTGVIELWRKYQKMYFMSIGRQRAQKTKEIFPIFAGQAEEAAEDYTAILMQLVVVGLVAACIVFLAEILFSSLIEFVFTTNVAELNRYPDEDVGMNLHWNCSSRYSRNQFMLLPGTSTTVSRHGF